MTSSGIRARLQCALVAGPSSGRAASLALGLRLASGAIFIGFGLGKFVSHAAEVSSFDSYGLPYPDTFVYAIGVLEIVGGLLLAVGLFTRIVALLLAGDMAGAIVVSGIAKGEDISLTLAPLLLVAMVVLLWTGPGARALDHSLIRPNGASPR